jgi:hypothetical protein
MHDAMIPLTENDVMNNFEQIKEAAEEVSFDMDSDMEVTNVSVDRIEAHTDRTPDGEEIEVPGSILVFFWLDLPEHIDYAKEGNASGIEIDLHWEFTGELYLRKEHIEGSIEVPEATLDRTKRCNHPEDQRVAVEVSNDYCEKCGGPAIQVQ